MTSVGFEEHFWNEWNRLWANQIAIASRLQFPVLLSAYNEQSAQCRSNFHTVREKYVLSPHFHLSPIWYHLPRVILLFKLTVSKIPRVKQFEIVCINDSFLSARTWAMQTVQFTYSPFAVVCVWLSSDAHVRLVKKVCSFLTVKKMRGDQHPKKQPTFCTCTFGLILQIKLTTRRQMENCVRGKAEEPCKMYCKRGQRFLDGRDCVVSWISWHMSYFSFVYCQENARSKILSRRNRQLKRTAKGETV